MFVIQWFADHPKFLKNNFYIASDSYSGAITPVIAQQIINGKWSIYNRVRQIYIYIDLIYFQVLIGVFEAENEAGVWPYINLAVCNELIISILN